MYRERSTEEIQAGILGGVSSSYDKTPGNLPHDLAKASAEELVKIHQEITRLRNLTNVDLLAGDDLTRFVFQRKGVVRKAARKADGGAVQVMGNGTVTVGDLFETPSGVQFEAAESRVVLEDTPALVKVKAVVAGTSGNVPAGTITQMPITLQGIVSVTNLDSLTGGYNEETDEDLRERYYEALRKPPTSGNKYHYQAWAKEVEGVGDALILSLWNGPNTVKAVIIDDNREPAPPTVVSAAQAHIDPLENGVPSGKGEGAAPTGAYCTVVAAGAKNIVIKVKVIKSTGATDAATKESILSSVKAYFRSIAFKQSFVSFALTGNAVLSSNCVEDYTDFTLNNQNGNIQLGPTEVPVLTDVVLL